MLVTLRSTSNYPKKACTVVFSVSRKKASPAGRPGSGSSWCTRSPCPPQGNLSRSPRRTARSTTRPTRPEIPAKEKEGREGPRYRPGQHGYCCTGEQHAKNIKTIRATRRPAVNNKEENKNSPDGQEVVSGRTTRKAVWCLGTRGEGRQNNRGDFLVAKWT